MDHVVRNTGPTIIVGVACLKPVSCCDVATPHFLGQPRAGSKWSRLAAAATVAAITAITFALRPRRRRIRLLASSLPESEIPADFRASGVLFFTRDATGSVAQVLLAIEERKVSLKELGQGSGSARRQVVVFPQGKREPADGNAVATALREYVEETADAGSLAVQLQAAATGSASVPMSWFPSAKMAVAFCEVPPEASSVCSTVNSQADTLPLRPVWVSCENLRHALEGGKAIELETKLGAFPLFPMARRFLHTPDAKRWLGIEGNR